MTLLVLREMGLVYTNDASRVKLLGLLAVIIVIVSV